MMMTFWINALPIPISLNTFDMTFLIGRTYNSLNKFDCLSYVNSSVKLSIESSELRLLKPFFDLFTKNLAALAILNNFWKVGLARILYFEFLQWMCQILTSI